MSLFSVIQSHPAARGPVQTTVAAGGSVDTASSAIQTAEQLHLLQLLMKKQQQQQQQQESLRQQQQESLHQQQSTPQPNQQQQQALIQLLLQSQGTGAQSSHSASIQSLPQQQQFVRPRAIKAQPSLQTSLSDMQRDIAKADQAAKLTELMYVHISLSHL